jgi:hypothetical protein
MNTDTAKEDAVAPSVLNAGLGRIAYEAAAKLTDCKQPWEEANQDKWNAAATAVADELRKPKIEEPKGDTPCPECNPNGVFKYSSQENCICGGRAWLWKLG